MPAIYRQHRWVLLYPITTEDRENCERFQKAKFGLISGFHGSPNGMEIAALRRLIKRWKDDPRVMGCIHGWDATASKAICDAG
jgi:hypothetical protein